MIWLLLSVLLLWTSPAHAQLWSGILAPTRAVSWQNSAGVAGGIPSATWTRCTTGTGTSILPSTSTAAQINTAIAGCDANHYVELGPGTFTISATIQITKPNVVLRGSG